MSDTNSLIQHLLSQGVPMRDIQRALQQRRTRESISQGDLREARKQRVGVLL